MSETQRRRRTLASRIALLCIGVAIITGLLAGVLAVSLIRTADSTRSRHTLSQLADAAQASADRNVFTEGAQAPVRRLLQAFAVRYAVITPDGAAADETAPSRLLVRQALTPAELSALQAGRSVSTTRTVVGRQAYVEARPIAGGGAVLLVQGRGDAGAAGAQAIRRVLLALGISVLIAALLGLLVARRVSRPLRRTAEAAHALAAGSREVAVVPVGPSEVASVAEAVNTIAAALSHSEARQREFLISVSHELRTPLTAITGYAESIADGVIPPDQSAAAGAVMLGEAHRLERLVGDLLDLARLDSVDFRIELADVDLVALGVAAAQVWAARCHDVGVRFIHSAPGYPVVARTDGGRVRQIVDGLLENALRVTPPDATIVLEIRNDPDGSHVMEVRDGGPGLTDDDLSVAFDRAALYQRYRGVRRVGTGLGLAIVHGLTVRLGGRVEAGHAPEAGARFTVHLP
ncbi:MAG: HAMP domain-containing sensor histidine kinase [Jatrophihabitantaceae bacterium]